MGLRAVRPARNPSSAFAASAHVVKRVLTRDRANIGVVVTISITADAFAAIASTLPKGSTVDARPDGQGAIW